MPGIGAWYARPPSAHRPGRRRPIGPAARPPSARRPGSRRTVGPAAVGSRPRFTVGSRPRFTVGPSAHRPGRRRPVGPATVRRRPVGPATVRRRPGRRLPVCPSPSDRRPFTVGPSARRPGSRRPVGPAAVGPSAAHNRLQGAQAPSATLLALRLLARAAGLPRACGWVRGGVGPGAGCLWR